MSQLLPPPSELGAPEQFNTWRAGQDSMVMDALCSTKRFIALQAPTGLGKTVVGITQHLLTGQRLVYLTSTKALSMQIMGDFSSTGLIEVKGQSNYECIAAGEFGTDDGSRVMVDSGSCHSGIQCPLKLSGCLYFDRVRQARFAKMVTTNYAFWLSQYAYGEGIGEFDIMICDEGHDIHQQVNDFLAIQLDYVDAGIAKCPLLKDVTDIKAWKQWGNYACGKIQSRLDELTDIVKSHHEEFNSVRRSMLREIRDLKLIQKKVQSVAGAEGEWVIENREDGKSVRFDPLTPAAYAEKLLFMGIKKCILMSATITKKTCELLGIKDGELDFFSYHSPFDPKRRPVIHIPTIRLNNRTQLPEKKRWVARMDQIIGARLDRKGVIHSISYDRSREIKSMSEYSDFMMVHSSHNARSTLAKFKEASPPAILVSPSVHTGVSFDHDLARYQIIAKMPFIDTRSAILQARRKLDTEYEMHLAMMTFLQTCGRGTRAESDWCETLVCDDSMRWFMRRYGCDCGGKKTCTNFHFAPLWFLEAIVWWGNGALPVPLG